MFSLIKNLLSDFNITISEAGFAEEAFNIIFQNNKGLSNYLNMRQNFLKTDFSTSNTLATTYDADLENFWTQKSNFIFYSFLNN